MKEIPLERVREHWARAADYPADKERVYTGHAEAHEFEQARGKLVLEYGCGGGSDAMSFLRRDARVWYADVVPGNVEAAGKRMCAAGLEAFAYPLPLKQSAAMELLGTETFDIVSSHGVVHHIVEPMPVLREFHRILKPGGLLFLMFYTELLEHKFARRIEELTLRMRIAREEAFGWCTDEEGTPYARSYTVDQGRELLEEAGFRLLRTVDYNRGEFRTFKAVRL